MSKLAANSCFSIEQKEIWTYDTTSYSKGPPVHLFHWQHWLFGILCCGWQQLFREQPFPSASIWKAAEVESGTFCVISMCSIHSAMVLTCTCSGMSKRLTCIQYIHYQTHKTGLNLLDIRVFLKISHAPELMCQTVLVIFIPSCSSHKYFIYIKRDRENTNISTNIQLNFFLN